MSVSPDSLFVRGWSFTEESFLECKVRYTRFGSGLYDLIQEQMPEVFQHLKFYQSDVHQPDDSYAICELERPFSIQIDPDCEVICLGGDAVHTEIGAWFDDPCQEAINFIRSHFLETEAKG
jgi:hypothetical protein